MHATPCRPPVIPAVVFAAAFLAGCAGTQPERAAAPEPTRCTAPADGDPLVGSWMGVRKQPGVAGELRTHMHLRADGTMSYAEQLSRPGKAPQGLMEAGCWQREDEAMVLRTLESNGSPVDPEDPIYKNRYQVTRESAERISLKTPDGAALNARRMPADYRLPL